MTNTVNTCQDKKQSNVQATEVARNAETKKYFIELLEDMVRTYRFIDTIETLTEGWGISEDLHIYNPVIVLMGAKEDSKDEEEVFGMAGNAFAKYVGSDLEPDKAASKIYKAFSMIIEVNYPD